MLDCLQMVHYHLGSHVDGWFFSVPHQTLEESLGQEVRYASIPAATYRGLGFPGADDLGNMFQFKRDFNEDFRAARSVEIIVTSATRTPGTM